MQVKIPKAVLQKASIDAVQSIAVAIDRDLILAVETIKKQMIEEFMNHPVTEEILNGANASNSSDTLGGYGNLFSFIGFDNSDAPIIPIIEILESIEARISSSKSSSSAILTIYIPSAESIFKATPLPWANGRSWAKGIESGISGVGFYINQYGSGRSDAGIQTKKAVRAGKFKNTTYISFLLNKYKKIFSSINGATIKLKNL
jgi:hypothetical protein